MNQLGFRILISYAIYSCLAPVWTVVALRMRPRSYVLLLVVLVWCAAIVSHIMLYFTEVREKGLAGALPGIWT